MTAAEPVCVEDFEHFTTSLPGPVRDFIAGGSGRETTLRANRAALDAVAVLPRVGRDLTCVDTRATLATCRAALPVALAPMAYQRIAHPEGELAAARAAAGAGVPFTIGTLSSFPLEVIAGTGATTWFQLYWLRDRDRRTELVRRAEDVGCSAIVLTVDVPWMGRRLRDLRNAFALPTGVQAANLDDASAAAPPQPGASAVATHTAVTFSPSQTWSDIEVLRAATTLPLLIKGILHPRDAARAADCGADAVVVSNHGGRQLDGAAPSIRALPAVRAAVGDRCQVLMDSGVRGGVDVLRAIALGADGVLLGRPILWALAYAGEEGVRRLLELMALEVRDAFGLAGCASVDDARNLETL